MEQVKEDTVPVNNVGSGNISGIGNSASDPPVKKKSWSKRIKVIRRNMKEDLLRD